MGLRTEPQFMQYLLSQVFTFLHERHISEELPAIPTVTIHLASISSSKTNLSERTSLHRSLMESCGGKNPSHDAHVNSNHRVHSEPDSQNRNVGLKGNDGSAVLIEAMRRRRSTA
jgi:hypothetical protein